MEKTNLFKYVLRSKISNQFFPKGIPEWKTIFDLKMDSHPHINSECRDAFVYEVLYSDIPIEKFLSYQMAYKTKPELEGMKSLIKDFMKIDAAQLQYFFDGCIPLPDEDLDYTSDTFIYKDKRDEILRLIEDPMFLGDLRKPMTHYAKPFRINFQTKEEKDFKKAMKGLIMPGSQSDLEAFFSGEVPIKQIAVKKNKKEFILYFFVIERKEFLVDAKGSPISGMISFLLCNYFILDEVNAGSTAREFDPNYVNKTLSEHRNLGDELRSKLTKYKPLKMVLFGD